MDLKNTFIIYGMGKSGVATANAILNAGGNVYIGDDKPIADDFLVGAKRLDMDDFPKAAALIAAPGLPFTHPKPHKIFEQSKAHHIPIMCDIELFYLQHYQNPLIKWIAITGTNGKSTVTDLACHILNQAGHQAYAGGNIGTAIFDLPVPRDEKPIFYVLEISSYQADLCHKFAPDAVGFLNLSPDHLERHGSMAGYFNSKMRLMGHLNTKGQAYVSGHERTDLNIWEARAKNISLDHKALFTHSNQSLEDIKTYCNDNPILAGMHQYHNSLTACALAQISGCTDFSGLKTYTGLEHRCEFVAHKYGIYFINDSKATNAEATRPALHAYKNIYWLAGGVAKSEGIAPLLDQDMKNIVHAYFFGTSQDDFLTQAQAHHIPSSLHDNLENAFNCAFQDSKTNESNEKTILLSPSCASFDAFKNFEHRGTVFKELIKKL